MSGYKKNIVITIAGIAVFLIFVWGLFCVSYLSDKKRTIDAYIERQRIVIFIAMDTKNALDNQFGPIINTILEHYIKTKLSKRDVLKDIEKNFYAEKRNLPSYGRLILLVDGKPIYCNGPLERYFKPNGNNLIVRDSSLANYFSSLKILKSGSDEPGKKIVSGTIDINGAKHLMTAGIFRIASTEVTFVEYAELKDVLIHSDHYERMRTILIMSLFASLFIIVLGIMLVRRITFEEKKRRLLEETARELRKTIDEKNNAQEDLKKFKALVESANIGVAIADMDGTIAYCNKEFANMHGFDIEYIEGKDISLFQKADSAGHFVSIIKKILADGGFYAFEFTHLRKDGSVFPALVSASLVEGTDNNSFISVSVLDMTEIKRAESARRASDEKYRALVETTDTGFLISDDKGIVLDANDEYVRLAGRSSLDEIIGKCFFDWTEPAAIDSNRKRYAECLESGYIKNHETEYTGPDGKIIPIDVNARVIHSDKEVRVLSMCRDISERRAAQEAVKKQLKFNQLIIDMIPSPVFYKDKNGAYLGCNREFGYFLGLSKEDIIGFTVHDIFPEELASIYQKADDELLRTRNMQVYEANVRYNDGSLHDVLFHKTVFDAPDGSAAGIIGVMLDITARKEVEDALRTSEAKARAIIDSPGIMCVLIDIDGRVVEVNETAAKSIGAKREDLLGKIVYDFFAPEVAEIRRNMIGRVLSSGESFRYMDCRDGRYFDTYFHPVKDTESRLKQIAVVAIDTTENHRAQEEKERLVSQLHHSQKMESIGRLAGGVAHDFNNILAVIIGNAELALRHIDNTERTAKSLGKIIESGKSAKDLTMKMLTLSRKEKLDVRTVPAAKVVDDLVDMLKRTLPRNIRFEYTQPEKSPRIMIDTNQILQALLNICLNSSDAMPDGGQLSIIIEKISLDASFLASNDCELPPGDFCLIRIKDNGTGIKEEIRSNIFDPFFTTKEKGKGTGLGLFITLGIVKNHRGFMNIYSSPGKGSTVDIYLPEAGNIAEEKADEDLLSNLPKDLTVLLIDDDSEYMETMVDLLEGYGTTVFRSLDCKKAIELFSALHNEIDIVLLDMVMPEIDGVEVFYRLKEIEPDTKIIICSGFSIDGKASGLLERGAAGFLQKPFTFKMLQEVIASALVPKQPL